MILATISIIYICIVLIYVLKKLNDIECSNEGWIADETPLFGWWVLAIYQQNGVTLVGAGYTYDFDMNKFEAKWKISGATVDGANVICWKRLPETAEKLLPDPEIPLRQPKLEGDRNGQDQA